MIELSNFIFYVAFFILFFVGSVFLFLFFRKEKTLREIDYKEMTFVVPCFNSEKYLQKTVDSIKNADYPQELVKIIVVNDGSTDNTLKVANRMKKKYNNIEVLSKPNGGKADSVNFGLKRARTELVAVLDSDTFIKKDLLKKVLIKFSDEDTFAVTSRLKPFNNKSLIEKMQYLEYTLSSFHMSSMGNVNCLSFAPAFTVFRRQFFLKHGYFDKGNLTEDLEIALRVQKNHYNIAYVIDSCAMTYVPSKIKNLFKQRVRWGYGTFYNYKKYRQLFFNKEYGDLGLFFLPMLLGGILLASIIFLTGLVSILNELYKRAMMVLAGWVPELSINLRTVVITLSQQRIVLFLFVLLIGTTFFYLTKVKTKEKILFRHYFVFITVYLWFLAIVYLYCFVRFLLNKKPEW